MCSPSIEFDGSTRRLSYDSGPLSSLVDGFDGLARRLSVDSGPQHSLIGDLDKSCGGSTRQVSFDSGSQSSPEDVGGRHRFSSKGGWPPSLLVITTPMLLRGLVASLVPYVA